VSHVHPTRDDRVVAALSESVGGPVGPRAGRARWWTPVRVVLAMAALTCALGMVQKAPCISGEPSSQNYRYSHMCYSDLPPLYTLRGLVQQEWPFSGDEEVRARYEVMEYPVGIAYWAWGTAWVTHLLTGSPDLDARSRTAVGDLAGTDQVRREVEVFTWLNGVGFAACALLAAWLLTRVNPRRPWDAAIFAASPSLALTGLINWDLLAVVFVAGALWAWSRGRPVLTGLMIGLGTATKLYPLFLLGGILVICLRRKRYGDLAVTAVWAAAAWLAANAPAYLTGKEQWQVFWSFNADRGPDLGSIWSVLAQASDQVISHGTVNTWSWVVFGAWCLGVLVVGLRAPETPRLAQLGFLVVAGFLLVNKVYSPQYVLWLLPLAALARPRWRDQIVWQSGELLYFAAIWWYLGGYLAPSSGGDAGFYWVAIVLRMLAELYLVGIVVRDVLWPAHDPVRREDRLDQASTIRSNAVAV
jgi:uncharacterized membrane protein